MSFPFIFELFIVLLHRALSSLPPPAFQPEPVTAGGSEGHAPKLPGLSSKAESCMSPSHARVRPLGKMFPASNLVKHATSTCPGIFMACSDSSQRPFSEAPPHTHLALCL